MMLAFWARMAHSLQRYLLFICALVWIRGPAVSLVQFSENIPNVNDPGILCGLSFYQNKQTKWRNKIDNTDIPDAYYIGFLLSFC